MEWLQVCRARDDRLMGNQITVARTPARKDSVSIDELARFIKEKASTCVHKPEGLLHYTFVTPSYDVVAGADDKSDVAARSTTGHYLQMYDWDSCFFSQAAHLAGIEDLPVSVVSNFLALKEHDGYIPRTISPSRIWDNGDLCKPFLSQTVRFGLDQARRGGKIVRADEARYGLFLQDLDCYLDYYERHRKHDSGLYHWRNVLESGVDDNLALLSPMEAAKGENEDIANYPDGRLLAVDLNSYLVAEFDALSSLATAFSQKDLAEKYSKKASTLARLIEEKLWSEELGLYCNLDPKTNKLVMLRAWTGLTPMICGFARADRMQKMIETNIFNEQHFLRPAGVPSVAASEPLYNQARRGLYGRIIVSNWQGPMWVLPTALIVRRLKALGMSERAEELSLRVVRTVAAGLSERQTMFENYNAETGQPLFAPKFMSWNILVLELINVLRAK